MKHLLTRHFFSLAAGAVLTFSTPVAASAAALTPWAQVRLVVSGWAVNSMTVHLNLTTPLVNPGACSIVTAGYATSPSDPGNNLFHAIALAGFLNRKEVQLIVDGCVFSKPRIIGVNIR